MIRPARRGINGITMLLYFLDLAGVAVFAVSGALAAGRLGLDLLGVLVLASLTAIGGGTLRDVLMNRHPVFWMARPTYLLVICAAALGTVLYVQVLPIPAHALLIADALGLALFALSGAQLAEAARLSPIIVILMGTMTGVAGGVMRDICSNQIPLLLRQDIYASAAIAGIALYLVLKALGLREAWAFWIGVLVVVTLRLSAIFLGWSLPVFQIPKG
ncbi:trimeric intracellular cation channel family protein [Polaromonas sp.]|uniref:trimeric intracellular cation channel family protein n=1 Tax=Polaromonas sp. TaxID=1869339 RepID=UPI003BABEB6E